MLKRTRRNLLYPTQSAEIHFHHVQKYNFLPRAVCTVQSLLVPLQEYETTFVFGVISAPFFLPTLSSPIPLLSLQFLLLDLCFSEGGYSRRI